MSNLSGFDSEAIGFESITSTKKPECDNSTQTSEFGESGVGSQTNMSKDMGTMASPEELNAQEDVLKEYPPPGLNEFLRRVMPGVMEMLDQSEPGHLNESSDSDDGEETLVAKLYHEVKVADFSAVGAGDQALSVLSVSWSSAGNSVAVSVGSSQHEDWCTHDGLIRIYTVKHTSGEKLTHTLDIHEKNCVSVIKYHPSVSAILAYGTTTGEVVMCNLRNEADDMQLTSPADCHGSKLISCLQWADPPLANTFLIMHINNTGKRRGASDQVLITSGCDGTINVWQVNANLKIFENIVSYKISSVQKMAADISCFDFIKAYPLRPSDEKSPDDVFVVGTKCGEIFLCKVKPPQPDVVDPLVDVLEGHSTCVLGVNFSLQKPEVFVSVSIDSEIRVYDINQKCPSKIFHLDVSISSVAPLPHNPCVIALGSGSGIVFFNVMSGKKLPIQGTEAGEVTAVAVSQMGSYLVAAGDRESRLRVWELPSRRIRFTPDDFEF